MPGNIETFSKKGKRSWKKAAKTGLVTRQEMPAGWLWVSGLGKPFPICMLHPALITMVLLIFHPEFSIISKH